MTDILTTYSQKPLASFYDWIVPGLPGAPMALIDQRLRAAATDFCQLSRLWRVSIDDLTVTAGEPEIELDVPTDAEVFELKKVRYVGATNPLEPATEDSLEANDPNWDTATGTPANYLLLDESVIRLVPIPDTTTNAGLSLQAFLRPTQTAATLPSFLLGNYIDSLAKGVRAGMLSMPNVPWANLQVGAELMRQFNLEASQASIRAAKGFTKAPLRVSAVHSIR
jgi:hypothetical protein